LSVIRFYFGSLRQSKGLKARNTISAYYDIDKDCLKFPASQNGQIYIRMSVRITVFTGEIVIEPTRTQLLYWWMPFLLKGGLLPAAEGRKQA